MIIHDKTGGRKIELFVPFDFKGQRVESITLAPLRFGHTLRWNEGAWEKVIEMVVELAGVEEAVIRELRYPDADRVMEAFMMMLTPEIRSDVQNGRIPVKRVTEDAHDEREAKKTNGSILGPGVPLPPELEHGFDLEEAP